MRPDIKDVKIMIPTAFEVHGGRRGWLRGRILTGLVLFGLMLLCVVGLVYFELELEWWQKVVGVLLTLLVWFFLMRFWVFSEGRVSDYLEGFYASDYEVPTSALWKIYEIDSEYPYVCRFLNGYNGIFVRMVRGAVVGHAEDSSYYHFECLSDAYMVAHSLNIDMVHIDYMGDMGNDTRLDYLLSEARGYENPELRMLLMDVFQNLRESVKNSYAVDDVYLFLSRDNLGSFFDSVRAVVDTMLGVNFLSYKVLDRASVGVVVRELFNCHDFDVMSACEDVVKVSDYTGVRLLSLSRGDVVVRDFRSGVVPAEVVQGVSDAVVSDTVVDEGTELDIL